MKKSNKKRMLLLSLILVIIASGITFAFMFIKTNTILNKLIPARCTCTVEEIFDKQTGEKSSITVKNTGNVDSYIRVRLVSNWVDEKGDTIGKESEYPNVMLGTDWIDVGNHTYAYTKPVTPGGSTTNLLENAITLIIYENNKQSIDVVAECIQTEPLDAVYEAWGLDVDIDGNLTQSNVTLMSLSENDYMASNTAIGEMDSVVDPHQEYVYVTVNYLDNQKMIVSNKYEAKIEKGTDFSLNVKVPIILGYGAFYNPQNLAEEVVTNATQYIPTTLTYEFKGLKENQVINVYFKPADVPYGVKYFFQNIHDDLYTERTDLYKEDVAETGTEIKDDQIKAPDSETVGFRILYHYPEKVAADGSTVFELYYDREYFKIDLDLDGGYGVDDIYLRYDSPYNVNIPKRPGYTFKGWQKLTMGADGNLNPTNEQPVQNLSGKIPAENQYYKAVWEAITEGVDVTYVVWKQNADPEADGITYKYSYWSETTEKVVPGNVVSGRNIVEEEINKGASNTSKWGDDTKYFTYNDGKTDKNVTVKGDGSTVVNVYYDRKDYTLNFYYAREKVVWERKIELKQNLKWGSYVDDPTSIVVTVEPKDIKTEYEIPVNINKFSNCKGNLTEALALKKDSDKFDVNDWIQVESKPTFNTSSLMKYDETEFISDSGNYTRPSGLDDNGIGHGIGWRKVERTEHLEKYKYYGIQLKVKYGASLISKWPYMCFDNAIKTDGTKFVFSAWGPENSTYYIQHTADFGNNPTVKGMYFKLDNRLLYDDTIGESDTISFLSYWANASTRGRYAPREWRYFIYREPYKGEEYTSDLVINKNGKDYIFSKGIPSYDSNDVINQQTPPEIEGLTYTHIKENGRNDFESIDSSNNFDKVSVNYFYDRNYHKLTFLNYNKFWNEDTSVTPEDGVIVGYNEYMSLYKPTVDPPYPDALEPGAFKFAGWYESPECADGTEYNFDTERMPDSDVALYAKYVPVDHTVRFFKDFESYAEYEKNPTATSAGIHEEKIVSHGNVTGKIKDIERIENDFSYTFAGWFYYDNGNKIAFDPYDTPVKRDINVFADWGSLSAQPYVIHYVLEENPNVKVADDTYGYAYQGTTRTFFPKGGNLNNDLFVDYNEGYYPTVKSHSITIKHETNKENPEINEYTFTYVSVPEVSYKVQYLDADTNEQIYLSTVNKTSLSVVTERFYAKDGYIPDAFYKRLVLAVVKDKNGNWVSSPDNIITFYYHKSNKSMCAIHYMVQTPGSNPKEYVEQKTLTEVYYDADNPNVTPKELRGYTLADNAEVEYGSQNQKTTIQVNSDKKSFKLDKDTKGVDLYVYFECKQYLYSVRFVDLNSHDANNKLKEIGIKWICDTPVDYGQKITINLNDKTSDGNPHVVPDENKPNPTEYSPVETSKYIVIRDTDATNNVLTFYYVPVQYTAEYHVVTEGGGTGGNLNNSSETISGIEPFTGVTPTAELNYEFEGWYIDPECKTKVTTQATVDPKTNKLIPKVSGSKPAPNINKFYAKFVPIVGNLIIESSNVVLSSQPIVYTIQKNDVNSKPIDILISRGSETIIDLPAGDYTVTENNSSWSWRYSNKVDVKISNVKVGGGTNVTAKFISDKTNKKWLNGFNLKTNIR